MEGLSVGFSSHSNTKNIADALNRHFENDITKEYAPDLTAKKCGYL
jgi:hypothetical protein